MVLLGCGKMNNWFVVGWICAAIMAMWLGLITGRMMTRLRARVWRQWGEAPHRLQDAGIGIDPKSILPKDHWIYGNPEYPYPCFEPPPMPMKMGTDDPRRREFKDALREAGKYAVRSATMDGKEGNFDPDALLQNLVVGMLGYSTPNGLTDDEWANPKKYRNLAREDEKHDS